MYGLCVLVILWTLNGLVGGYGKGSPGSSCKNLEPQHYGATPQTSESPYRIDVIDPTSDGKTTGMCLLKESLTHRRKVRIIFKTYSQHTCSFNCQMYLILIGCSTLYIHVVEFLLYLIENAFAFSMSCRRNSTTLK